MSILVYMTEMRCPKLVVKFFEAETFDVLAHNFLYALIHK